VCVCVCVCSNQSFDLSTLQAEHAPDGVNNDDNEYEIVVVHAEADAGGASEPEEISVSLSSQLERPMQDFWRLAATSNESLAWDSEHELSEE